MDVTPREALRLAIHEQLAALQDTYPDLIALFQAFLDLDEESYTTPPVTIYPTTTYPSPPLTPWWVPSSTSSPYMVTFTNEASTYVHTVDAAEADDTK